MTVRLPATLIACAAAVVAADDPREKVALARAASNAWRGRRLGLGPLTRATAMPERPGRPARPVLLAPREMPKRSTSGARGRFALLHSLAHIELNAIDLTWDLIGRFASPALPRAFFDDWVQVGAEEAKHFALLAARLEALGGGYGDLPAHDGLWQAAQDTGHSLIARVAVVPLVLEARGLDVTPPMVDRLREAGDEESAKILSIIYHDEKKHVSFGTRWFRHLCARDGVAPEPEFHRLVRTYFRGALKPPFNDKARSQAGLTPGFYKPLASI